MSFIGKAMRLLLLVTILPIKSKTVTQAKVYNSIAALEPLIETEGKVIQSMEAYLTDTRKKIQFIENHIIFSNNKFGDAMNNSKYFWDPLSAFSFMNRVKYGFGFIKNITKDTTGYSKDTSLLYPCPEDLLGAAKSIVRLQNTYRMNITQLANGTLVSNFSRSNQLFVENVTPMTSDDCFTLGLMNHTLQGFSGQLLWMREALRKYYAEKCEICTVTEEAMVYNIWKVYYNLGELKQALKWMKRYRALNPARRRTEDEHLLRELQDKVDRGDGHKTRKEQKRAWKQPIQSNLVGCYEKLIPPAHKLKLLQCGYEARSPYLTYAPNKWEVLSLAPNVIMIHDVIKDNEIEDLLKLAKPNLMYDTGIYESAEGRVKINRKNDYRIAKGVSMDESRPLAVKLVQRIADITGINRKSNMSIQVINYGIAGMYVQHVDFLENIKDKVEGDRLIAFVYFLSDVEQGGALIFPTLRLKVYPKKGSAIAWDPILPSGDGDITLSHTACPVIRGSRWTAVHWAKEVDADQCPFWYAPDGGFMTEEKYSKWLIKYKQTRLTFDIAMRL